MYEELLKDLDICSKADICTGCSQEGTGGIPECYQIVMEKAAAALRERMEEEKKMIYRDELVKELGVQIRKTITDNKGYVDGMIAASNVAQLMPMPGEERSHEY